MSERELQKFKVGLPPQPAVLFAIAINLVMIFGSAWLALGPALGLFPKPYGWILAAQIGMPWIAIGMVWCLPGWYSLFRGLTGRFLLLQGGETSISLVAVFFPTCFTVAAYYDYLSLVRSAPIILPACIVGVALLVAGGVSDRNLWASDAGHRIDLLIAVILSLAYGYATVFQVNCVLDHSPTAVYRAVVTDKSDRGRGWHLEVGSWGSQQAARNVKVPYELFKSIQPGQEVCIVQRAGALGISWYTAQSCPWGGGPVFLQAGGRL
jgi:hypothetical protein